MKSEIEKILKDNHFNIFGFCKFESVLPLFPTRSQNRLPRNPKSIITFLFPYKTDYEGERNLSLYCIGKDYHDIIYSRLNRLCSLLSERFKDGEFAAFCDTSPINECLAAYNSGLGFMGKNGLLINEVYGSYCFIGEIVTNLEFEKYSIPLGNCLGCDKCTQNCIGGALTKDGFLKENCLSFITQKKGELSKEEEALIKKGGLVWGCDGCILSCPMNKNAKNCEDEDFISSLLPFLTEEYLGEISDRAYNYKGEKILRRNIGIIYEKPVNNNGK